MQRNLLNDNGELPEANNMGSFSLRRPGPVVRFRHNDHKEHGTDEQKACCMIYGDVLHQATRKTGEKAIAKRLCSQPVVRAPATATCEGELAAFFCSFPDRFRRRMPTQGK